MSPITTSEARKLGEEANFHGLDKDVLTRRYAILRRVWTLNDEELSWITSGFLRKTTAGHLSELIDQSHDWKDRIEYQNKLYDLEFIDCSVDWLKENKKDLIVMSGRENANSHFYCFLIKRVVGVYNGLNKVKEL